MDENILKSYSTRLNLSVSIEMDSEEGDARSVVSGSHRESVELFPDQLEGSPADVMNGDLNEEPDQNHTLRLS